MDLQRNWQEYTEGSQEHKLKKTFRSWQEKKNIVIKTKQLKKIIKKANKKNLSMFKRRK